MIIERIFKRISIYKVYNILGLVPIVWTLGLVLFYLTVAIFIGYFPTYGNPDPATIENNLIRIFGGVLISFFLFSMYCLYAFVGIFIIHIVYSLIKRKSMKYKKISYSVVGYLIFIGMIIIPGINEIFEWIID